MPDTLRRINSSIKRISLFFSLALLLASLPAALLQEGIPSMFENWINILISPCPLVTDYFSLGSLAAAFFNAGICGISCVLLMILLRAECRPSTMAGFFLVIAHCFYGLNFLNMWPSILGILLFCRYSRIRFRDNLDIAMFSTAFGPFFSELLFRYTLGQSFCIGALSISTLAVILAVILILFLGFAIPAMLPGALQMHKGYNLYNGGLAFGLLGLVIYALMYKTMGLTPAGTLSVENDHYIQAGYSYGLFINIFFILIFGVCLIYGWYANGKTFAGYRDLLKDTGHRSNFYQKYGVPQVLINIGFYGFLMLAYFDIAVLFTEGAGFTGATTGIILAAITFSASGQHPANVWPILTGYLALFLLVCTLCLTMGLPIPWTLSTQGYMNAAAFATGLCPLTGRYGKRAGMLAGFISAIICTSTSAIHGGFVLYNGGLTAGITALVLVPCLEFYSMQFRHTSK